MTFRRVFFSEPERRAFLDGSKTMFRRSINPQPYIDEKGNFCWNRWNYGQDFNGPHIQAIASPIRCSNTKRVLCPFGRPGDRIWVPEAFRIFDCSEECACYDSCTCAAMDGKPIYRDDEDDGSKWFSAGRMQKSQSRILLEIVSVRVERLRDISEADAIAEGIRPISDTGPNAGPNRYTWRHKYGSFNAPTAVDVFRMNLQSESDDWDGNKWVWVVEVRRVGQ